MDMIDVRDTFFKIVEKTNKLLEKKGLVVYPLCANIVEICKILTNKDMSVTERERKYPGIFLLMDFPEAWYSDYANRVEATVQILMVAGSQSDYLTDERIDKVFKPTLYPILEAFLKAATPYMNVTLTRGFTKINRPQVSNALSEAVSQSKQRELFNDVLDAIELRNLQLTILKTCN